MEDKQQGIPPGPIRYRSRHPLNFPSRGWFSAHALNDRDKIAGPSREVTWRVAFTRLSTVQRVSCLAQFHSSISRNEGHHRQRHGQGSVTESPGLPPVNRGVANDVFRIHARKHAD